jgi:predicted TIM-barrel fold metal-dependent hydrolase
MKARVFDAHMHIEPWDRMKGRAREKMLGKEWKEMMRYVTQPKALIQLMDTWEIDRAMLIVTPSPEIFGFGMEINDFILSYCKGNHDRMIPMGGINPTTEKKAKRTVEDLISKGLRGFKLHPPHQMFYPNDYLNGNDALKTLYSICEEREVPIMIHTGTSTFPGARSKYANPLAIDDVATDFPDLKIIMAHGGRPLWMNEATFLVRRFANVYMDISSIPPRSLLQYLPKLEKFSHKVLFGSDWPNVEIPSIRANADAVMALPLSTETKERILRKNAERLFPRY